MDNASIAERFRHFPPDTKAYDLVGVILGIELLAEGVNPNDLKALFNGDVAPELHPLILYRVKDRGQEGNLVTQASVSLNDIDRFLIGRVGLRVMRGNEGMEPTRGEITKVNRYLGAFRSFRYTAKPGSGQGLELQIPVDPINQIRKLMYTQIGALSYSPQQIGSQTITSS